VAKATNDPGLVMLMKRLHGQDLTKECSTEYLNPLFKAVVGSSCQPVLGVDAIC